MKAVFVMRDPVPVYGVMCISAYLKHHGHDSELVLATDEQDVVEAVRRTGAQVVAFSCTSGRHVWASSVGRALKKRLDVFTLLGGPHATFFPGVVEDPGFDAVCVGEGEGAIVELLDKLEIGDSVRGIPNLWVKEEGEIHQNPVRPLIDDLDALPFPDRHLYMKVPYIREYQRDAFIAMTGRGCPYNCTFCYNQAAKTIYRGKGRFVRRKSVDRAMAELREANEAYRLRGIIFEDDTFTIDADWLVAFLDAYAKVVRVPFICNARADHVTADLARRLAQAGCRGVRLGVETGNEQLRKRVLKKKVSNEEFTRAAAYFKEHGIKIQVFNILGIPGGDLQRDLETLLFNIELGADHPWCSVMNPYPGTEIRDIAVAEGVLDAGEPVRFDRESYFVDTDLRIPEKRRVVNLHHLFGLAARHPSLLPLVERMATLPLTPLYERLFKLDHVISLRQFHQMRRLPWVRFLWHCRGIY